MYELRTARPTAMPRGVLRPYTTAPARGTHWSRGWRGMKARRVPRPRPSNVSAGAPSEWEGGERGGEGRGKRTVKDEDDKEHFEGRVDGESEAYEDAVEDDAEFEDGDADDLGDAGVQDAV